MSVSSKIHKILGTLLSALMAVWFFSGLVMVYHRFPRVTSNETIRKKDNIDLRHLPDINIITEELPGNASIKSLYVDCVLGQTFFHVRTDAGTFDIPADSLQSLPEINGNTIRMTAQRWCNAPIARIDTLYELEQWIPFGKLREEFPIYKFHFADAEKQQLYISSKSGKVLQHTTSESRFWAWLGAIPHWVYFTRLRQDVELWSNTVVFLSGLGCIMCIFGIYRGFRVIRYSGKNRSITPFKKKAYRWHHIYGLVFGITVFLFCFSGMMSLARSMDWVVKPKLGFDPVKRLSENRPDLQSYSIDYRIAAGSLGKEIKQIEWNNFGSLPFYKIYTSDNIYYIDARDTEPKELHLSEQDVLSEIKNVHNEKDIKISLMDEYDTYYLSRVKLALPVWKVEIENCDNSCYYIKPGNAQIKYVDDSYRFNHWVYPAFHRLKLLFLVKNPLVWKIVMWMLMIGGFIVSITGVWLGTKVLVRETKHYFRRNKRAE